MVWSFELSMRNGCVVQEDITLTVELEGLYDKVILDGLQNAARD